MPWEKRRTLTLAALLTTAALGVLGALEFVRTRGTTLPLASTTMRPTFLLVGDSLTQQAWQGWGARLADAYTRKADVIVRGYSGYTTEHARQALAARLFPPAAVVAKRRGHDPPPPALITLWFGANDAALKDRGSASQHVPLARYEENVRALAAAAAAAVDPATGRVLVVTPPPVWEPGRAAHAAAAYGAPLDKPADRTLAASGEYARAACRAAHAAGVGCVNMWEAFQAGGAGEDGLAGLLSDGLHFSAAGHERAFEAVMAGIVQVAPHLDPEKMETDAPLWTDLPPHKEEEP